jgi:hypothetical protein
VIKPWNFTVIQEEYPFPLGDSRGKKKHAQETDDFLISTVVYFYQLLGMVKFTEVH